VYQNRAAMAGRGLAPPEPVEAEGKTPSVQPNGDDGQ
jgi:hypothetical protein